MESEQVAKQLLEGTDGRRLTGGLERSKPGSSPKPPGSAEILE